MPEPDLYSMARMRYGDMRRAAASFDVSVRSSMLENNVKGVYDATENMILIDRRIPYTAKRCVLMHELVHWRFGDDYRNAVLYRRAECRTRRLTASILVPPNRYAELESTYEADVANIANELDVTEEVIKDFQTLVLRGECL